MFRTQGELMPGVIVIHKLRDFCPVYMSSDGLEILGLDMEELLATGKGYTHRFLNPDFMDDYLVKLENLLKNNEPGEIFTLFHQVNAKDHDDWVWYISSVKVFHRNEKGDPTHTITSAFPLDQLKHIPQKAERLLAQNQFARKNLDKFASLKERSKEILRLVALGKSSAEIADELHLSVHTVNTHRRNIKEKLGISNAYEFAEYALAFDLI